MKITSVEKNDPINVGQFAKDIEAGLMGKVKSLSSKYFYDDTGSELFQKITQHPDYYLTNSEFEILSQKNKELALLLPETCIDVIELGVGDGHKTKLIIDGLIESGKKVNYFPIDISEKAIELLADNITENENLNIHGVVGEYVDAMKFVSQQTINRILVLFLGSNIGNFNAEQSVQILNEVGGELKSGDFMLIGFDLKKDINILNKAYNDSSGFTKKFNLNLLSRINTELNANFDLNQFDHHGFYNPRLGAMESYIIAKSSQKVLIESIHKTIDFKPYEAIHLEYSFKFNESDIETLAQRTFFDVKKNFFDSKKFFTDSLWAKQ